MATKTHLKKTSYSYYEKQRLRNVPLLLLLLLVEAALIYLIIPEVMNDKLWGADKLKGWSLITIAVLIPTPLLLGFFLVRFDTFISEEGIFYRWMPFNSSYQMILWDNIRQITLIDIKKIGGRWKASKGIDKVQFPGGRYGMVIYMKSGRKTLISSRRAMELNAILKRIGGSKYQSLEADNLFTYD